MRRVALAITPSAAAVAVLLAAGSWPALAAAPSWQWSAEVGVNGGVNQLIAVYPLTSNLAWAGGMANYEPLIEQWNGISWTDITPPVAQHSPSGDIVQDVAASSPSNLWATVTSASNSYALRWNGSEWTKYSFNNSMTMSGLVVRSPKDVWAFASMVNPGNAYVRRFNGRRWQAVAVPAAPYAVSAEGRGDDIYAVGPVLYPTGSERDLLMQWTGKAWRTARLPSLGMTRTEEFLPDSMLADGRDGIWITGQVIADSDSDTLHNYLLHWTGRKWRAYSSSVLLGAITSDGHGGLWLTDVASPPQSETFLHFRDGSWRQDAIPLPSGYEVQPYMIMSSVAQTPRTESVWAVGAFVGEGIPAVIYRFGG